MEAAREQFEQIFEKHLREVERLVARHTDNPDDVQDLTQEVFVRAFSAFDQFKEGTNAGAWLYRIAINVCANAAKARMRYQRHVSRQPQEWDMPADLHDVAEELAQKQEQQHLKQAMRSLPADQLLVLTLRFSDGLTLPEIAQVLGVPVDTVKSRLRAALAKLQSAYSYMNLDIVQSNQPPLVEVVLGQDLEQFLIDGEQGGKIYHSLGSLYLRKGLIAAALQQWSKAQRVAPTYLDAYLDSAQQYVAISQPAKAVDTLETAVSRIQSADLHVRLADLYLDNLDDFDEGIQHSMCALDLEPANPVANYTAGRVYYRRGRSHEILSWSVPDEYSVVSVMKESWKLSASYLEEALRLKEVFPEAIAHRAMVHLGEQEIEEAVREVDRSASIADGDADVAYYAGWVHLAAHDRETAEKYLRQSLAAKMTPGRMELLARTLSEMDRHQEAYDTLQQTLALTNDREQKARISVNMAVAAMRLNKLDLAIERSEMAIHWDPKQVHARCNLAETYQRKGESPRAIINLCMEGLRLDPRHQCFHRILAEAYYRLDKPDDALCEATTAVELEPQEAHRWLLRAKIMIKLGQYDEARKDVMTALDLEPENEDAKTKLGEIDKAAARSLPP